MKKNLQNLKKIVNEIKYNIILNSHLTGTTHLASCLSCTDIISYLYFNEMKINKRNINSDKRDRFILSKGHAAPALFQILAAKKIFDKEKLKDYGKDGSLFGEHPPRPGLLKGIESATGSLGHGLPTGVGVALGSKKLKKKYKTYVLIGDGECGEGAIWESAIIAAANKLNNLIVIVDCNGWQATGKTKTIMGDLSLEKKWKSFNWDTYVVNGNNLNLIENTFKKLKKNKQPKVIVAKTIKGHGIHFMEDNNNWHYRIPNKEEVLKSKKILLENQ